MELYSLALIFCWLLPLWFSGWILLPASKILFPTLPDGGLAAGRLLCLLLVSLVLFWTASFRLIPLTYSCWILPLAPIGVLCLALRNTSRRQEFFEWIKSNRKALVVSDMVFLLAFLFFVYLRLCQPEIRDQEKPMDSAIIGVLSRAIYLPADNPWFSGVSFTNYYYFGHFMAALLKRVSFTSLPYAYNLIQPVFCAFFLSILWSLCSAITRSLRAGVLAAVIIALYGNYEPARQLVIAWHNHQPLWPLDWWSTSRVVSNTINEYPFFTLALGDIHAHFFALSMGVLLLCCFHTLCYEKWNCQHKENVLRLCLPSFILGAIIMTNAWDAPFYLIMAAFILAIHLNSIENGTQISIAAKVGIIGFWLTTPFLWSAPFLIKFVSPTHGIAFERWLPGAAALLFWGSFAAVIVTTLLISRKKFFKTCDTYSQTVFIIGLGCILFPFFFYIRGYFDGELKHQDTFFKFWLQGWLLLGIATFSSAARIITSNNFPSDLHWPAFIRNKTCHSVFLLITFAIPIICTITVTLARSQRSANRLSLNGAQFLSLNDQAAISWLSKNAPLESTLIEAVGINPDGTPIGAYTEYGRMSYLTGIPAQLGWPQHAGFWGVSNENIQDRFSKTRNFYQSFNTSEPSNPDTFGSPGKKPTLKAHSTSQYSYLIWGDLESFLYGPSARGLRLAITFKNTTGSLHRTIIFPLKQSSPK